MLAAGEVPGAAPATAATAGGLGGCPGGAVVAAMSACGRVSPVFAASRSGTASSTAHTRSCRLRLTEAEDRWEAT